MRILQNKLSRHLHGGAKLLKFYLFQYITSFFIKNSILFDR